VAGAAGAVPARFAAALTAVADQGDQAGHAAAAGAGGLTGRLLGGSGRDELALDQQLAAALYLRGRGGAGA